ncbi:MAG: glycosyltransferase [Candidatus Brocadiaceae bacterium]|nr:glycosyltransferase [Candidatus Brocadiaceae bacterium]
MRISVIIPTKNRREDLLITLHAIIQQSCPPEEIVIVDQSQKDCKEEILELFRVNGSKLDLIYVWDKDITSLVEARTTGFNKSKCEIVFFVDDDITLEKNCIENLLQSYDVNPQLGGVGGAYTNMENMNLFWLLGKSLFTCGPFSLKKGGWFFTGWMAHYFHNRLTKPWPSRWFIGGMMSFKRHVVEEIGFDKQLVGHVFMDDRDFTFRASKKYPLAIDPKVKGYHRGGMVALYNMREDHEKRVSGEWYFFRKNIDNTPLNTLFFLWRMFGSLLVALLESIHHGSLDPLRGFLMGMQAGASWCRKIPPKGMD